ncbi:hypothetical protein ACQB6R_07115 [Propionibacteriaceae bacterium G1746]
MPIPSAAEMNPSDGSLKVFFPVSLGVVATLVLAGAATMVVLIVPAPAADVWWAVGMGAVFGGMVSLAVAPVTGVVAAAAREWLRKSLGRALLAAVAMWLVWVVIFAVVMMAWLGWSFRLWGNTWPFLVAFGVALLGALALGAWVHRSVEPLTSNH